MKNNFDFDDNNDDWMKHHDNKLDLYELFFAFFGTYLIVTLAIKIFNW